MHTSKFYFDKFPCSETKMLLFNEDFSRKTNLLNCVVTHAKQFAKKTLSGKKNRIIRPHELNKFFDKFPIPKAEMKSFEQGELTKPENL